MANSENEINPPAETQAETETAMIRRTMTPRELLWIRWFIGVGIPSLIALRAGLKLIFADSKPTTNWLDTIGDTMIAFGTAMGGFMDRLWGTWKDEKKAAPPQATPG